MNFLLSNDDGYRSLGIRTLAKHLACKGKLTIIAPETNCSGASHSLTLRRPVSIKKYNEDYYYVNGTSADCVHLAITGYMKEQPDMVISGINAGVNLGDDVLYSGTVAAAMEGRFIGCPGLAISLVGRQPKHFDTAGRVATELIDRFLKRPVRSDLILNINVPDLPYAEIKGYQVTRLGYRHLPKPAYLEKDPYGNDICWIGPAGVEKDSGAGTDFHAVNAGYVSVTPLRSDMTYYQLLEEVETLVQTGLMKDYVAK